MISDRIINDIESQDAIHLSISGGVDSMALFHFVCRTVRNKNIFVHYVNHNVSNKSCSWGEFIKSEVATYQVVTSNNIVYIQHDIYLESNKNFECQARNKRYSSILSKMNNGERLYLAHHSDDQVENVIMNLFKGRGLNGLVSLKEQNTVERDIVLVRPFLNISKDVLKNYLVSINKTHIEDESNKSINYDRNFIRNKLMYIITERFKSVKPSILSTYNSLLSSRNALNELIELKLNEISVHKNNFSSLYLDKFLSLSDEVKQEMLIYIFREKGFYTYSNKNVNEIIKQSKNVAKGGKMSANIIIKDNMKTFSITFNKDNGNKVIHLDWKI